VSVLLAGVVGSEGWVWAVDADPRALKLVVALAAHAGLSNVETVVGDAAATGLPAGSLDVAML
jgi:16S rRNA C967 or C1407 C5-methylase (RsmB/RsmF family)